MVCECECLGCLYVRPLRVLGAIDGELRLAEARNCLVVEVEVSLDEVWRGEREPLVERDVLELVCKQHIFVMSASRDT